MAVSRLLTLGEHSIRLECRDRELLAVLPGLPLPDRPAGETGPTSVVSLGTCALSDITRTVTAAARSARQTLPVPGTDLVPEMTLHLAQTGTIIVADGLGFVAISADWRRIEVSLVPQEAGSLAAMALPAVAVQELATHLGYCAIHASMVDRDGRGLLFCGERARGKSTSCLALGRAGWTVRGDDRCYVRTDPLQVWGPGGDMRLRRDAVGLWPDLQEPMARGVPYATKTRIPLGELVDSSGAGFAEPAVLFFPEVGDQPDHESQPLSSASALEELLCATGVALLPGHTARHFAAIADLVEAAPCFRLRLGREMSALPALIEGIIG